MSTTLISLEVKVTEFNSDVHDGNKLTIDFDKAGEKRVLDSFVERG